MTERGTVERRMLRLVATEAVSQFIGVAILTVFRQRIEPRNAWEDRKMLFVAVLVDSEVNEHCG